MRSFLAAPRFFVSVLIALAAAESVVAQDEPPRDIGKLYAQFCGSCHGEKLDGGLGGSLIDMGLDDRLRRGGGINRH